jgi:hypothetical protein
MSGVAFRRRAADLALVAAESAGGRTLGGRYRTERASVHALLDAGRRA